MSLLRKQKYNALARVENCVFDLYSVTAIHKTSTNSDNLFNRTFIEIHLIGSMAVIHIEVKKAETQEEYNKRCEDIFNHLIDTLDTLIE